jgi:branched-chain amino acid transport system substrate-binding protein
VLYNRGVSAAVVTVEAIRVAQAKYGKGKVMSGDDMRWAFENLNLTSARLQQLGATGLLPEIKTSCDNHEGSGKIKIQQWDGAKWVLVSDWIEGNKNLIHPLFKASAAQFAKEKGISPTCMKS